MQYSLAIENAPETISGGTGILLVHPSTVETDRVDTEFLKQDTDHLLVISTRTTAREVTQKLEHYEVDESRATILDTLSAERGYTRRQAEGIRYASSPDDHEAIVAETARFLESHEGKLRVSLDSITEMIYYGDEETTHAAIAELLALLEEHDAVGLFHLAKAVHEPRVVESFESLFDGVLELDEAGTITANIDG